MMKLLERHIARTVIAAMALVALIMTSILCLILLLGELKNIGEGDYGLTQAIFYVFMRLPKELYQFSPMFILLGGIIGLSILATNRELAVMRTAGLSVRRIIYSVLMAALLVIVVATALGEWVAPHLSYKAEVRKENAQNAGQAVVTAAGVWFHVDNNFIHVQHMVGRHLLEGVTRYQFDEKHHLQVAYFAKKLAYRDKRWMMYNVVKTTFSHNKTQSESLPESPWNLKFNPNLLNIGLVDPSEMSLPKLAKFARYLQKNGLQASEYQFGFWQRVFQPISSIIMIFIAIPFVLGGFSRVSMGRRIMLGILVGFTFFIANALLGQLCIVYQLPAMLAAGLPILIFLALGVLLVRRLVTY